MLPGFDQLNHLPRRLSRANSFEAHSQTTVGILLDDLAVVLFVLAGIAVVGATQPMQTQNCLF